MAAETPKTIKKSKKERSKKRKLENEEEKVVEDQEPVIKEKKKFKKAKKEKKVDAIEKDTQQEDADQKSEENAEAEEETETIVKKKGPSKRQLKKEKAMQQAAIARESNKQDNAQKALTYVSTWKHAKEQWKFNKVKQIWLIDNLLDEKYVPDEQYSTILEYFEGSKGHARQKLIDKAMKVIKKAEDNAEEDEEKETLTTEYKRARELLQALPNET